MNRPQLTAGGPGLPTPDAARWAGLRGWNLRCRRCGLFGAMWQTIPGTARSIALCDEHAAALAAEEVRHRAAMAELTAENFRQPVPPPRMPSMAEEHRRRAAHAAGLSLEPVAVFLWSGGVVHLLATGADERIGAAKCGTAPVNPLVWRLAADGEIEQREAHQRPFCRRCARLAQP